MSAMRARYVTVCQQLLALGVVVIALVPATRVVSLDVVGVGPELGVAQPSISVAPTVARQRHTCASLSLRMAERGEGQRRCRESGRLVSRAGR